MNLLYLIAAPLLLLPPSSALPQIHNGPGLYPIFGDSHGKVVTFVPWQLYPFYTNEFFQDQCTRGTTSNNQGHVKERLIGMDKCHSEKKPFEAFMYGLENHSRWFLGHSSQPLPKTCDLLFYDQKGCHGSLVWAFQDVNRGKFCHVMDGKTAISVKLSCRKKKDMLPEWIGDLEAPIPDVTPITFDEDEDKVVDELMEGSSEDDTDDGYKSIGF